MKDRPAVAAKYFESKPSLVVVDDALSEAALAQIRSLLLESTVFFETKMPSKFGGDQCRTRRPANIL